MLNDKLRSKFMEELLEVWNNHPYLRFGQLLEIIIAYGFDNRDSHRCVFQRDVDFFREGMKKFEENQYDMITSGDKKQ